MWALRLKFNPEPIYCIQLPVISIKPFHPSATTISGRQERLMLSPGRALAQLSAERWGVVGRIQTGLNSGYWKRYSGYTVLGFWYPQLQTSLRKHLVWDGQTQSKKWKLWISSRILDHSGFSPACDCIHPPYIKKDLGPWQDANCVWQLLRCPAYYMKYAAGESEVPVGLGPAGNWRGSLTDCGTKGSPGVKRLMYTFLYFWVISLCWVFSVCFDTWDSSIFCQESNWTFMKFIGVSKI